MKPILLLRERRKAKQQCDEDEEVEPIETKPIWGGDASDDDDVLTGIETDYETRSNDHPRGIERG